MDSPPKPVSFPWAELAGAAVLIGWRAVACTPVQLFQDWLALLAAFWAVTALTARSRAWPWVTALFMLALLALYLSRQIPITLSYLRTVL